MSAIYNAPTPYETYEGDGGKTIMVFLCYPKYEDDIFNHYSPTDYWLKHKTDDYFLLIDLNQITY